MTGSYHDILHLPRPISTSHPPMPIENRAAQFSPFAALTGYEEAIKDTARITIRRIQLDEHELSSLDQKLGQLIEMLSKRPEISITYFQSDGTKKGGKYITTSNIIKKIDDFEKLLILESGEKIPIQDILTIDY